MKDWRILGIGFDHGILGRTGKQMNRMDDQRCTLTYDEQTALGLFY